jgi:predicted P-loop ATPase
MTHDKDTEIALTENFIWNLEELADLNRKQVADMKAVISRESIKQRRAYARNEKSMKRIVNFWGSTNKTEFLADTQNTRWLCFNVLAVNHDYNNTQSGVKNIDIDKVWAQAYHLYKSGFHFQLTKEERDSRDRINRSFESMPEEKQLIMRYFQPGVPNSPTSKFMLNYEIREFLNQNTSSKTRINENNIGRSMKQLNFVQETKRIKDKTARGYWVKVSTVPMEYDKETVEPELFEIVEEEAIDLPF